MKRVFISYAQADRQYMQTLREYLQQVGYKPLVNKDVGKPQAWQFKLVDSIKGADIVVPIITQNAIKDVQQTYEWALAIGAGVPVYPVVMRGVNPHPHLAILDMYDFGAYVDETQAWENFLRDLQRVLGDPVKMVKHEVGRSSDTEALPIPRASVPARQQDADAKPAGYYLIVEHGTNPPQEYRLNAESISLGRDDTNNIQILDHGVSRTHLRFVRTANGYQAMDMGSTNGTIGPDGDKFTTVMLRPGDVLRIGETIALLYKYVE